METNCCSVRRSRIDSKLETNNNDSEADDFFLFTLKKRLIHIWSDPEDILLTEDVRKTSPNASQLT